MLAMAAMTALLGACEATAVAPEVHRGGVTLGVIRHGVEQGPLRLGSELELELEEWVVVVADVELHACTPDGQVLTPARARSFWVTPAYAHVPDSATRLGSPYVESLLGAAGRAQVLGEVAPPHGEYCALVVIVAPADEDVVNPTEVDTARLVGSSALLRGRWRRSPAEAWTAFEQTSKTRAAWSLPLDPPLRLSLTSPSAFVLVDKVIDGALLEGIAMEPAAGPTEAFSELLLERLGKRVRRYEAPAR